eukprot:COSAG02_NODE_6090_length_3811_cov_2.286369_1_plen_235_part_10
MRQCRLVPGKPRRAWAATPRGAQRRIVLAHRARHSVGRTSIATLPARSTRPRSDAVGPPRQRSRGTYTHTAVRLGGALTNDQQRNHHRQRPCHKQQHARHSSCPRVCRRPPSTPAATAAAAAARSSAHPGTVATELIAVLSCVPAYYTAYPPIVDRACSRTSRTSRSTIHSQEFSGNPASLSTADYSNYFPLNCPIAHVSGNDFPLENCPAICKQWREVDYSRAKPREMGQCQLV